ncbi:MAG TPA: peptidase M48 [Bacteroidales bacterium]|nr:MAG: hypothetical protein A2X11_04520 [Bacteroidetes bacterium GWE2_42_24]OFY27676.1 MAG: hypothetical protein A2X09_10760 [Bacteroidetes bacterium GWF2_43_11]HAQ64266.1 peptidase M48 [Bacteroidales bacterium]HBZ66523.1 peptidase M48 [Bacteroidales bacterium]
MESIKYQTEPKEHLYLAIKISITIAIDLLIVFFLYDLFTNSDAPVLFQIVVLLFYLGLVGLYFFFAFGVMVGHIKGNGVRLTPQQLPAVYNVIEKQSMKLGLRSVPDVYLLQSGGVLNAFATRFVGSNYIVLYSELVEAALEEDPQVLEFIIAHELGHIKCKHMTWRLLTLPGSLIPFLGAAYSRACEYTCDNIGAALAPKGVRNGLLILAAGRKLFKEVDARTMMRQNYTRTGFWFWFAEKVASHPHLSNRLERQKEFTLAPAISVMRKPDEFVTADHSKYMPS